MGVFTFIGGLLGLMGRLASIVGIVLAAVALIGLLAGLKACYDSSVIETHQAGQDAANAKADLKANENSSTQRAEDTSRLGNEAAELERVNNANPDDARARRIARQRCLRLQQDARAAGREPPTC